MGKMYFAAGLLLALLLSADPAAAQEDAYRRQLSTLLESSGAMEAADVIMAQLIPAMKQLTVKDTPLGFWDEFQSKWNREIRGKLVDIYVPIYEKYLTIDDLEKIVAFYASPVGKKLAAANPAITRDAMQAGQQLGMEVASEMLQEMERLGYR